MRLTTARQDVVRFIDSYASLLVLLLGNFFLLELVDDARWGAIGSTLLAGLALIVAISDPDTGHRITRRHTLLVAACPSSHSRARTRSLSTSTSASSR